MRTERKNAKTEERETVELDERAQREVRETRKWQRRKRARATRESERGTKEQNASVLKAERRRKTGEKPEKRQTGKGREEATETAESVDWEERRNGLVHACSSKAFLAVEAGTRAGTGKKDIGSSTPLCL